MFLLLRHLARGRREAALPRPPRRGALQMRHVDAGSCNGCEHELHATMGPHYDLSRFGLSVTASPRHADVLLVTGSVTSRMRGALERAYEAMSEPRIVAALGDCALGCGVLGDPAEAVGRVEDVLPVAVRIPGCPPVPEAIAAALVPLLHGHGASARAQPESARSRRIVRHLHRRDGGERVARSGRRLSAGGRGRGVPLELRLEPSDANALDARRPATPSAPA